MTEFVALATSVTSPALPNITADQFNDLIGMGNSAAAAVMPAVIAIAALVIGMRLVKRFIHMIG